MLGSVAQWFDPSAFVLPATGFIGTLARNSITGPDLRTVDLIGGKTGRLNGFRQLQLRFECFHLLNPR